MINFYKNKKIFITGHTGFKGSWLTQILLNFNCKICGYSNKEKQNSLFNILNISDKIVDIRGDVQNLKNLRKAILNFEPDIIFHLAAQPLVIEGYLHPLETFKTNIMGTLNLLEILREYKKKFSLINVTTDKVYKSPKKNFFLKENNELCGLDPYSNSKSCSELITYSYKNSFLFNSESAITTCRSGNVIGGGDFSKNRIISDCFKNLIKNKKVIIRNPKSIRPYQHVLESNFIYLYIAWKQYIEPSKYSGEYNIGPDKKDIINNMNLVKKFCFFWDKKNFFIIKNQFNEFKESDFIYLNNSKLKQNFNWKPILNIDEALKETVNWYKCYLDIDSNIINFSNTQINNFINKITWE